MKKELKFQERSNIIYKTKIMYNGPLYSIKWTLSYVDL